jgi:hypothetical protein
MATKKPSKPAAKPVPKTSPKKLQNLAAKPPTFDETVDEQLVDHSGVFRVTSAIQKDQVGHGDDTAPRFANDSLVMAAQRDGFPDDGPTLDDALADDNAIDDATSAVAKRQRLATLAALAQKKKR